MGRYTAVLNLLPPGVARRVASNPEAMARLQRAAAEGPEALAAAARQMAPDMSVGSDLWTQMSRSADANNPGKMRQRANLRPGGGGGPNPTGDLTRIAADNIDAARASSMSSRSSSDWLLPAAVAAGGAAGVGLMVTPTGDLTESGNPADLREDPVSAPRDFIDQTMGGLDTADMTRRVQTGDPYAQFADMVADGATPQDVVRPSTPPPQPVGAPPPAEPMDYSMEARKLIDQLNAMRRRAGGEVPEARPMMQRINQLIEMGNRQRNTPGYRIPDSDPARDPYQQARTIIDQVNNMYRQGFQPSDPRIQQLMARVRELHAQGDAIRNRGGR